MKGKRKALVVGINEYTHKHSFSNLQIPAYNAKKIKGRLETKCEFEVTLLEKVTRKQLKEEIISLFIPKGQHPDIALLYFSGYVLTKDEGISEVFLTTSDSNPSVDDLGISLQWLKEILKESPVTDQIIIFDCCYHEKKKVNLDKFLAGNEIGKNRFFIVSFHNDKEYFQKNDDDNKFINLTDAILNELQSEEGENINHTVLVERLKSYEQILNTYGDYKRISFGKPISLLEAKDKPEQKTSTESSNSSSNSPYKGLAFFNYEPADAEYFYGRDTLTDQLLEKVDKNNFLALLGTLGSGKSSIIRAGIVYQLKQGLRISGSENWYIPEVFQPGKKPLNNLAQAFVDKELSEDEQKLKFKEFRELLDKEAGLKQLIDEVVNNRLEKVVLVIDQFEEVFSLREDPNEPLSKDSEQYKFIECLLKDLDKMGDEFCLVLAIRADFFGKCAEEESFGLASKIQQNLVTVTHMSDVELTEVITQPAEKLDFKVDDELKNQLINDVKQVSRSLPLLQNALTELWKRKPQDSDNKELTNLMYEEIKNENKKENEIKKENKDEIKELLNDRGSLEALLDKYAEDVYDELNEQDKKIAKYILVNLIKIGNSTGSTRTRVYITDIKEYFQEKYKYSQDKIDTVVEQLASNNIIIVSEEVQDDGSKNKAVTLAHEVLIIHWTRLCDWLNEKRKYSYFHEEIELATKNWEENRNKSKFFNPFNRFLYDGGKLEQAVEFIKDHGDILPLNENAIEFIKKSLKNETIRIVIVITFFLLVVLIGLCIHKQEIEHNKRVEKYQLEQSVALTHYSDALFREGQKFDALVEGLRAAIPIQKLKLNTSMKSDTLSALQPVLRRAVYGVKERNRLSKHIGSFHSLSFSSDSKTLASGSTDGTIKLWNAATGEEIRTLKGHSSRVNSVSFSSGSDVSTIASGSTDGTIKLWNATTGEEIKTLKGHNGKVYSVSFSADGKILASGSADRTIKLWDVDTGEEIRTLKVKGHSGRVHSVSFNADGETLASGGTDGTVRIWDLNTNNNFILSEDNYSVDSVSFSPDGKHLASGSADGKIKIWSKHDTTKFWNTNSREITTLNGHDNSVYSVSFNKDSTQLASGSRDNTIKLWDVTTGKEITTVTGHSDSILNVSFSPDDKILASAAADGSIKFWDISRIQESTTFKGHNDSVTSVSSNPKDNTKLASGSLDGTIKIWDTAIGKEERTIYTVKGDNTESYKRKINSISFSHDGKILASGSADGFIQLWDTFTGKEIKCKFLGKNTWINSIAFSFNDKELAFVTLNHTVEKWNLETDKVVRIFEGSEEFSNVSFSPDGELLAASSFDNTIKLWDVATGKLIKPLKEHKSKVNSVSFSADGQILASGSSDNTIKLWNVATGKLIKTLKGHSSKVNSVSFSPDGKLLASGSTDKTIKLWDTFIGKDLKTFTEHTDNILSVTFSPDGKTIASGSADQKVMLWKVSDGKNKFTAINENLDLNQLIKRGCDWVGGYLQYNSSVRSYDKHLCDNIYTGK
jgi:WD40 repeat protein